MLDLLTCRSVLIAVLFGTVASAKERVPQLRNVTFPHRPDQVACPVYVAGEIATVSTSSRTLIRRARSWRVGKAASSLWGWPVDPW
jgi:hypothetical protein